MKDILYGSLCLVNVIVCAVMVFVSYSDRLNPADYPLLACAGLFFPFAFIAVVGFMVGWLLTRKRYALVSFATLIICLPAISAYTPISHPGQIIDAKDLHIVSFNTHNFAADTLYEDKSEIVDYIELSSADIVCMQETRLSEDKKKELFKFFSHIEVTELPSGAVFSTLSRHPILKTEVIDYESTGNASICLYIKYKYDTLRVISNHLESTHITMEDRAEFQSMVKGALDNEQKRNNSKQLLRTLSEAMVKRAPQVDSLAKFIGENSRNTIFVGDMNDTPISYAHYRIAQVLQDCYKEAGSLPGFSYLENGMFVRIDHAFCSEDWIPEKCFIDYSISASDHYPIVTYLKKVIKK